MKQQTGGLAKNLTETVEMTQLQKVHRARQAVDWLETFTRMEARLRKSQVICILSLSLAGKLNEYTEEMQEEVEVGAHLELCVL